MQKGVFFFAEMLPIHMGDKHGINLPEDVTDYNPEEYPHWEVYRCLHQSRQVDIGRMKRNAELIGQLDRETVMSVTEKQLEVMGVVF